MIQANHPYLVITSLHAQVDYINTFLALGNVTTILSLLKINKNNPLLIEQLYISSLISDTEALHRVLKYSINCPVLLASLILPLIDQSYCNFTWSSRSHGHNAPVRFCKYLYFKQLKKLTGIFHVRTVPLH